MHQQDVRGSKGAQRQQQQLGALVGARPRASCRPLKSRGAKTGRFSTAVWAASVSWRARAHAHVPACRLSPNSASPATARKARARKASTTTAAAVVHAQSRACPAGASAGLPRGQRSSRGAPTASAKPRWHAPPAQCHTHGEGYPSCSSGHVATSGSGGAARNLPLLQGSHPMECSPTLDEGPGRLPIARATKAVAAATVLRCYRSTGVIVVQKRACAEDQRACATRGGRPAPGRGRKGYLFLCRIPIAPERGS